MNEYGIQVVICDDEERILLELKNYVEQSLAKMSVVGTVSTFSDGRRLVKALDTMPVDILLLDIDMPYMDGMEIARLITERQLPVLLIFVTCKESLVYDSFQYQPFSFIRKSRYEKELEETLRRAVGQLHKKKLLTLQRGSEHIRLQLDDILYFEADGNYMKIVMKEETMRQRGTLCDMEKQLANRGFVRIHKGFLVNQNAVYRLHADKVVLANGEELPIGRSGREEARNMLLRSFRI